jgi:mannan endo-1,4-beta-mannosidase
MLNAWISDAHNVVGKPFVMGEFNTQGVDRSTWWTAVYNNLQTQDADGSLFWWYTDPQAGADVYSVKHGAPELAVFAAHSADMQAKSGNPPTSTSPRPSISASASASPRPSATASPSAGAGSCSVGYSLNDWGGGFVGTVTITNTGSVAITGWTLAWTFGGNQTISNAWNTTFTQTGQNVRTANMSYNNTIAARGNVQFGLQGTYSGTNAAPAQFTLNGATCTRT